MPDQNQNSPSDARTGGNQPYAFPVVCLGASAGGLKSLETFLSHLPEDSGMTVVVLTHTDPDRASLLPDILKRTASIPVVTIEDGTRPEPNTVYLPPSNRDAVLEPEGFHLHPIRRRDGLHLPIDIFLESLAKTAREMAGCAILSGTGTDGTLGLRLIKEKGGVALAEKASTAQHYGMPESAIDTGLVDFVLEPDEMPGVLTDYFDRQIQFLSREGKREERPGKTADYVDKILAHLAQRTRHDFSLYKKNTLIRRIERRMSVTRTLSAADYLEYLRGDRHEAQALFQELLIGVTEFFREPEVFEVLQQEVLPDLVSGLDPDETLRVWVPGCATGEEVYSVAMILREYLAKHNIRNELQMFGTDIDKRAIEKAREGVYPQNIITRVGEDRLERFFRREEDRYRVKKEIREPVIFAEQDILRDPPFTSLDLLLCRNLLIYLESEAQDRLVPLFHYSLKPQGVLVLGGSESTGHHGNLFTSVNKKLSIYRKQVPPDGGRPEIRFPTAQRSLKGYDTGAQKGYAGHPGPSNVSQAAEQFLLDHHTPACVVVNKEGYILHIHGRTGKYLELSSGKPDLQVMNLAREGLRFPLSSALRRAASSHEEIRQEAVRVRVNDEFQEVDLRVIPLSKPSPLQGTFLILFEEATSPATLQASGRAGEGEAGEDDAAVQRNIELEKELSRVREDYRSALEELETSNEELKSVNEEMNSQNEELQSTNEELESSREELQSLNEELNTVNAQLHSKMEELSEAYGAITDALNSTQIALLFLDNDLQVKRFTPEITELIHLIDTDLGRSITHIAHNLDLEDLTGKVGQVQDSLQPLTEEIRTRDGHWYRMCIMINRTRENTIEGTVLTFINIDAQKQAQARVEEMKEQEVQAAKRFADRIVDTVQEALVVLDADMRVVQANRRFYELFQLSEARDEAGSLLELGEGRFNVPELRKLLDRILTEEKSFEDYGVEGRFPNVGYRRLSLNARLLKAEEAGDRKILLSIRDVTDKGTGCKTDSDQKGTT